MLKLIISAMLALPKMAFIVMKQLLGLQATIILIVTMLIVTIVKFFKKCAR